MNDISAVAWNEPTLLALGFLKVTLTPSSTYFLVGSGQDSMSEVIPIGRLQARMNLDKATDLLTDRSIILKGTWELNPTTIPQDVWIRRLS